MYHAEQRRQTLAQSIHSLWSSWAIAVGSIAVLITLAPLIDAKILPILAVALNLFIMWYGKRQQRRMISRCWRLPHIVQVVLIMCAVVFLWAAWYITQEGAKEWTGQAVSPDGTTPMIPILVIAPFATIICAYYYHKRRNSPYCKACRLRNSDSIDSGIVSAIFSRESERQITLLFWMTLTLSIAAWVYYMTVYTNVNLNKTDRFVFIIVPVAFYLFSLIYLGMRYYSLNVYLTQNASTVHYVMRSGTTLRYLITHGEQILVAMPRESADAVNPEDMLIDVPLKILLPFREKVADFEAANYFTDTSGITGTKPRLCYVTRDRSLYFNVFHYGVHVDNPEEVAEKLKGVWMSFADINQLIEQKMIAPSLVAELNRIYTVSVTWKTYTEKGRRRYDIKHYRPSFHLRDIYDEKIDFDNPLWLHVSDLNQDKPFFHLRRIWHSITSHSGV